MSRVYIIGAHPPTIGGVSIHVGRLGVRLAEAGHAVTVFDPYTKAGDVANGVVSLRRPLGLARLLAAALLNPPDIVHLHVSDVGHPWPIRLFCLLFFRSNRILTVHSGTFPSKVGSASPALLGRMRSAFAHSSHVIAVNEPIASALRGLVPGLPVSVTPPYLAAPRLPVSGPRDGIIASGYGTPIYGWESVLQAYRLSGSRAPLHLVFYNTYAPVYFEGVVAAASRLGPQVRIHRDLAPDAFQQLLADCHTYVRATDRDGDSVAVREALDAGLRVIATDVVPRPEGCVLYARADVTRLGQLMGCRPASPSPRPPADFFKDILALYGKIIANTGRNHRRHSS